MAFNHLNIPDQWQQYFTKYPQGYTILESLIQWVGQVDLMVDHINGVDEIIEEFRKDLDSFLTAFDENLTTTINTILMEWLQDGTMEEVISQLIEKRVVYQTIEELQNAPKIFLDGTVVEVLGYYTAGDGAGHKRIISDSDDGSGVQVGTKWANYIVDGFINITHFGAKTEVSFDNSTIINNILKLYPLNTIFIPNGVFSTKSPVVIGEGCYTSFRLDIGAVLQANSAMEAVVIIDRIGTGERYKQYFTGGVVDGNNLAETAFLNKFVANFSLYKTKIQNGKTYGLRSVGGYELIVDDIQIDNFFYPRAEETGLYIDSEDGHYSNIVIRNYRKGIWVKSGSNRLSYVHPWIYLREGQEERIHNSIGFDIGGDIDLLGCFSDSFEVGFKSTTKANIKLTDCSYLLVDPAMTSISSLNCRLFSNNSEGSILVCGGKYVCGHTGGMLADFKNKIRIENANIWLESQDSYAQIRPLRERNYKWNQAPITISGKDSTFVQYKSAYPFPADSIYTVSFIGLATPFVNPTTFLYDGILNVSYDNLSDSQKTTPAFKIVLTIKDNGNEEVVYSPTI